MGKVEEEMFRKLEKRIKREGLHELDVDLEDLRVELEELKRLENGGDSD